VPAGEPGLNPDSYANIRVPVEEPAGRGAWRALGPIPGERTGWITDLVVDATGTPWVMARGGVYWWDGENWIQAKDGDKPYASGYTFARLLGGSDRGAYMSQRGQEQHQGLLFELEAGRVEKLADFYYDTAGEQPGLYVSRSGDLFNFGARFVAVLEQGKWKPKEVRMGQRPFDVSVADFGPDGPVVFVARQTALATIWDGAAFRTDIALPNLPGDESNPIAACRWGDKRVLLWRYSSRGLRGLAAVELEGYDLKPVDVGAIVEGIGADSRIHDGWSAPDGSALLLFTRAGGPGYELGHIRADGTLGGLGVAETRKLGWDNRRFTRYPDSVLLAPDGTLWLGTPKAGIASIRDGKVELHDWAEGDRGELGR